MIRAKGKEVTIEDTGTGGPLVPPLAQPLHLRHEGEIAGAVFSPDGSRVVTSGGEAAWVLDATTGQPVAPPLRHAGPIAAAVFSGDGSKVVTTSDDRTARVWDATTGRPLTPPLVHEGGVFCAAFSRDGSKVVTGSGKAARVWDAATGRRPDAAADARGGGPLAGLQPRRDEGGHGR